MRSEPERSARRRETSGWILAALLVGVGALIRIGIAFSDPSFDRVHPDRMLKSDPALLHYLVQRIAEGPHLLPADLRADPRIEHPDLYDVPANLPVVQEITTAWLYRAYRALGGALPLHVFAVLLMGVGASAATLGVYGLSRELAGDPVAGVFAAALFTLSPAAYRSIGFIFVNEDLSLPFYALHLWLLARALRVGTPVSVLWCALALGAALASWHAMSFVVALEAAAIWGWCLRTGRSPFSVRAALVLPAVLVLLALCVPFLWKTRFLLSLPMALLAGLTAAGVAGMRGKSAGARRVALLGVTALVLAMWVLLARSGAAGFSDYGHVFDLVLAKLRFLGERPEDPQVLSMATRLLWQGPFDTATLRELFSGSVVGAVLLPVAAALVVPGWWRGEGDGRRPVLVLFALLACVFALLIRRNLALAGLLLPVVVALTVTSLDARTAGAWLAGLALAQLLLFASVMPARQVPWYFPEQQAELAAVLPAIRAQVPRSDAILSDVVTSGAVLAGTGNPIVLQPKWESASTRQRLEEFLRVFYFGSLDDFRQLLRKYDARYVLIDRDALWRLRWTAGLPGALVDPIPNTAAAAFLARDTGKLENVPGFRLVYRSTLPTQLFWLYEAQRP